MEIVVSDEASGLLSILGANGHSVKELLLHIGAQLWGLAYKCRENTWIWITGCHTALNLSSQIIF